MIHTTTGGIIIDVRVIPRASRSGVAGTRDDALLVRLNAPPVDGAANDELIHVIAKALDVPRRSVEIASGARGRLKRLRVSGITLSDALRRLSITS
jgi:uncharacterized protein